MVASSESPDEFWEPPDPDVAFERNGLTTFKNIKPSSCPRVTRIDLWRNEVAVSSPVYCACSALTLPRSRSKPRPKSLLVPSHSRKSSTASSTTVSGGSLLRGVEKMARTLNRLVWEDEGFPGSSPEAKSGVGFRSVRGSNGQPAVCPACKSPMDGAVYKRISGHEFGLVQTPDSGPKSGSVRGAGPKPKPRSTGEHGSMGRALLKRVSQVFRRTGMSDPRVTPAKKGSAIYGGGATIDYDQDEVLSDNSSGRPRIGIEDSVARLRRAKRLLEKGARSEK